MRKPSLEWGIMYQTLPRACPELWFLPPLHSSVLSLFLADWQMLSGQSCFMFWANLFGFSPSPRIWPNNSLLSFLVIMLLTRFKKLTLVRALVLIAKLPLKEIEIIGPQFSAYFIPYSWKMATTIPMHHLENQQWQESVFHACIHISLFKSKKTFPGVSWETFPHISKDTFSPSIFKQVTRNGIQFFWLV